MAVRFDLKKFEEIKQAYIAYIERGKCDAKMLQNFATYKSYLEADEEICNQQRTIKAQKDAERRRIEEQKKDARQQLKEQQYTEQKRRTKRNTADKQRIKQSVKAELENIGTKRESQKAAKFHLGPLSIAPFPNLRVHISPIAKTLQEVNTYDDLKYLMNSSFLNTIQKDDDFAVLKSTIVRCTTGHEEDRNLWLKTIEQRKAALKQMVKPKRSANYIPPKPVLIYVPNGGMPTYKRKR